MKKIWLLTTLLVAGLLLTGCNKTTVENPEIIDDCVTVDWEDSCIADIDEPVVEEPVQEETAEEVTEVVEEVQEEATEETTTEE